MHPLPALCLLFTIVLAFRAIQVQGQKTNEEEHLCSRLAKRQLDRIHLKSITFSPNLQLIIYEGNRFYRISDSGGSGMHDDHIQMPEQSEGWNEKELKSASSTIHATSSPTSAYFLTYGTKTILGNLFSGGVKKVALLLFKANEAFLSIAAGYFDSSDSYPATLIYNRPRPAATAEEFALIVRQESDDEKVSYDGYVLHKDTWHNSSQYVLYDLQLDGGSSEMKVYLKRNGDENNNNPAPPVYYHIQRTTASGEVLLVQGGGNEEKEKYFSKRSLFSGGLPVGYRHRYSTFLFDQQLGCVYRLELGYSLSFDRKPRPVIRVKRTNIPYERFFRCSAHRFPAPKLTEEVERRWPANRCDQNYLKEEKGHGNGNGGASSDKGGGGGGGGGDVVDDRTTTTPSSLIDVAVDWKKVAAIYGGGLLLLIVVFGAFLCCCRRRSSAGSSCSASGKGQQQQTKHGRPKRIMHFLMEKISSRNSYAPSFSAASTSPFSTTSSSTSSNASIISSEANSMIKKKKQQRPNTPIKKSPWVKKLGPGKKGRRW